MKIDTMRKIDRWIGIPLTWGMTLIFKCFRLNQKKQSIPRRILFIELSEMGSAILADPAMRKARQTFQAELFFVIFLKNKPSLTLLNTVSESNIFTLRDTHFISFIIDIIRFIFWMYKKKIDTVIDLELFSRATILLSALSFAVHRVGFHRYNNEGTYRGQLLTHPVMYNPHLHIAKNFIALINALIKNDGDLPYSKSLISDQEIQLTQATVSEVEKSEIQLKLKQHYADYNPDHHKIILINPNASDLLPQRRWPLLHFKLLISKILSTYSNALILITGSPEEYNSAQNLKKSLHDPRCINFAGAVSFQALVPLYSIATIMITNDSGPGHFSAVTRLPTIVLFGPETPNLYRSLGNTIPIYLGLACSPCVNAANHRKSPCQNNLCMQWITPDQIMKTIKTILVKE